MDISDWQYIGDGVYASCDGFHVKLVTDSPSNPGNIIYLEDTVVYDFIQFLKKIGFINDLEAGIEEIEDDDNG